MKLRLLALVLLLALAGAGVYWFVLRDTTAEPHVRPSRPVATIGTGSAAVGVGADGTILTWLPPPEEGSLPELPLATVPRKGRLRGTLLQQLRVLSAAPAALLPYIKGSSYGEAGVDVELRTGVELRFGEASMAARKWRAAVAVLADPSITALDYVDLSAPRRPSVGGSGHALPPVP